MAGCVGAELLEFGKEVFNEMAGLVYILELVKGTSGHHRLWQAGQDLRCRPDRGTATLQLLGVRVYDQN
jgi:hypothetical protein